MESLINLKLRVREAPYPGKQKIRLNPGMRSLKEKEMKDLTWKCSKCNRLNLPQRRLFVTLPVLKCECGRKSTLQFDFSLHKIEINDTYLVPKIRDQLPRQCCPNSLVSTAEICWRVKSMLEGLELNEIQPNLSVEDLLLKYYYSCGTLGIKKSRASNMTEGALAIMCNVMATMGVESTKVKKPMRYKFPYYTGVKKDFSSICQLLADGYVMTTSMYAGKIFGKLRPGRIYKSPRRGPTRHAITLIGAGRRRGINYYHFLNSWGRLFCLRVPLPDPNRGIRVGTPRVAWRKIHRRDKARGGFGLLRAGDISSLPVTFLRHGDDFKLYPNLEKLKIQPAQGKGVLEPLESSIFLNQGYEARMMRSGPCNAQGTHVGP